jgi:hypothetical protein
LDKSREKASCVTIALYYARELGLRRREDACAGIRESENALERAIILSGATIDVEKVRIEPPDTTPASAAGTSLLSSRYDHFSLGHANASER